MSKVHERPATAAEQYAQASATHYTGRDLLGALPAYGQVIESHPSAVAAGYARSQMKNIVNLVINQPPLLQRVARGDAAAVSLVLDRYAGLVWTIARRQVGSEDAEELVQEVFIDVWKSASRYDPELGSEATFITTIARRRFIDHWRRTGRRPKHQELKENLAEEVGVPDSAELADEARVAAEALQQLRPDQRKVLQLAIVEGLTQTQIAEVTRLPLGTVKSHARRGLERVRSLLGARDPGATTGAGT